MPAANLLGWAVTAIMLLGSPLAPLLATLASGRTSYLRRPMVSFRQSLLHTQAMHQAGVVTRALESVLKTEPHERIEGSCTHCGQCCLFKQCIFLAFDEHGKSSCTVHGRWLWRKLRCSDYPVQGPDIELYQCPSFWVNTSTAQAGRTIPIYRS